MFKSKTLENVYMSKVTYRIFDTLNVLNTYVCYIP